MTIVTVVISILIGVVAGWVARKTMNEGHGLGADLLLGIAGSGAGSLAFWVFGASADMGVLPMAVAAGVGASTAILMQRNLWAAAPVIVRRSPRTMPTSRR
jgi:uncharacterized membrane protein YeaQ/YmgE (transglycosylase-associated protein family)